MKLMATIRRIRNLKSIRRQHAEKPAVKCPHCFGACSCVICLVIRDGLIEKLERELLEAAS